MLFKEPVLVLQYSVILLTSPARVELEEHLLAQRYPGAEPLRLSKSVTTLDIRTL